MTDPLPGIAFAAVRGFVKDAGERALATFLQTFLSYTTVTVAPFDPLRFGWRIALSVSAGAALLSMAKSVYAVLAAKTGTASLTSAVVPRAAVSAAVLGYGDHAATMKG